MTAETPESRAAAAQPAAVIRNLTTTQKVTTEFGSMYVHVEVDDAGRPAGGSISEPGKAPSNQIVRLVAALSAALDVCLRDAGADGSVCEAPSDDA